MHTIIRDATSSKNDFVFYADRLNRLIVEAGLGHLPFTEKIVKTPTGAGTSHWLCAVLLACSVLGRSNKQTAGSCSAIICCEVCVQVASATFVWWWSGLGGYSIYKALEHALLLLGLQSSPRMVPVSPACKKLSSSFQN
jgi:hypothetical protein